MSTSNGRIPVAAIPMSSHGPLRLRMAEHSGRNHLDGGWWLRSRDLAVELTGVLVVPPGFTLGQGADALPAAATAANAHSATDLLNEVTDRRDLGPMDHWEDDGGSWWGADRLAPSSRTGR